MLRMNLPPWRSSALPLPEHPLQVPADFRKGRGPQRPVLGRGLHPVLPVAGRKGRTRVPWPGGGKACGQTGGQAVAKIGGKWVKEQVAGERGAMDHAPKANWPAFRGFERPVSPALSGARPVCSAAINLYFGRL